MKSRKGGVVDPLGSPLESYSFGGVGVGGMLLVEMMLSCDQLPWCEGRTKNEENMAIAPELTCSTNAK